MYNPRKQGILKLFKEDTAFEYCFADSLTGGNSVGSLLVWLFLKSNAISFHGKEGKIRVGAKPLENVWDLHLLNQGKRLF